MSSFAASDLPFGFCPLRCRTFAVLSEEVRTWRSGRSAAEAAVRGGFLGKVLLCLKDVLKGLGCVDTTHWMIFSDIVLKAEMIEDLAPGEVSPVGERHTFLQAATTEELETIDTKAFFASDSVDGEGMGGEFRKRECHGRCLVDGCWKRLGNAEWAVELVAIVGITLPFAKLEEEPRNFVFLHRAMMPEVVFSVEIVLGAEVFVCDNGRLVQNVYREVVGFLIVG